MIPWRRRSSSDPGVEEEPPPAELHRYAVTIRTRSHIVPEARTLELIDVLQSVEGVRLRSTDRSGDRTVITLAIMARSGGSAKAKAQRAAERWAKPSKARWVVDDAVEWI